MYSSVVASPTKDETCERGNSVALSGPDGYIGSQAINDPGTLMCTWRIEAEPGQRINITLINFYHDEEGNTNYG